MTAKLTSLALLVFLMSSLCVGHERKPKPTSLQTYLSRIQVTTPAPNVVNGSGSLWNSSSAFADLGADHKARAVGDLVIVRITEQLLAQSSSSVATQRKLDASSGISSLAGKIDTRGIDSLFSPHSEQALQGQGQTSSQSLLQTSVAGRIVAILPGDTLVIQAERQVAMNNERQTVVLRGIARPSDISPENTVMSTQLSNLEVEVTGKGIVSDSTRPPMFIVRWLLKILGM